MTSALDLLMFGMSKLEELGITREEVKDLMEAQGCCVFEAKRQLTQQRLEVLVGKVEDPNLRLILSVLVEGYQN